MRSDPYDDWTERRRRLLAESPVLPRPAGMRPVWVRLDALVMRAPDAPRQVVEAGLDMSGNVRGLVSAWYRSVEGDWLGLVNFAVPYADGRSRRLYLEGQLVSLSAMTPRQDNKPIGHS